MKRRSCSLPLVIVLASVMLGIASDAHANAIQSYLDWRAGMTRAEVLETQRLHRIQFSESSGGWLVAERGVPLPFAANQRANAKLSLRFEGDEVALIQVEFADVANAAAAVDPVRRAENYLRQIGGWGEPLSITDAELQREIEEGIASTSNGNYVRRNGFYNMAYVYIAVRDRRLQCRISIHRDRSASPSGGGATTTPPPAMTGTRMEEWKNDLVGSPDVQFGARIASIHALLVSPLESGGNAAAAMRLGATIAPTQRGGTITVSFNQPVGEDMRRTSDEVFRCMYVRHGALPEKTHLEFSFADKWGGKDGPSAGVACALLVESLLKGFAIPDEVAVTGDLNADSSVQPVGGVADKIRGALLKNCTTIGIPLANEEDVFDLVVEENLRQLLTGKIFTMRTLDDALELADVSAASDMWAAAVADFEALQKELTEGGAALLYDPGTAERLQLILDRAPNLLSAKILRQASQRSLPARYSLVGSLVRIDNAMSPFAEALSNIRRGGSIEGYRIGRGNPLQEARNSLSALRQKSDERLIPVIDAQGQVILQFQRLIDSNAGSTTVVSNHLADLRAASERAMAAWKAINSDRAIQDKLMERGIHLDLDG